MTKSYSNRIWITWTDHRRTRELANALGAKLIVLQSQGAIGVRHLKNTLKTFIVLFHYRDSLIIVQNPSRILAAVAALSKLIFRFPLLVDRHTNFRLGKGVSFDPRIWFAIACSNFSLRFADLTVVTNHYLKQLVERKSGRGFVLTDKIPTFSASESQERSGREAGHRQVLFICTYAADEPFEEVIEAAQWLASTIQVFVTGSYRRVADRLPDEIPSNVTLTGYVSEQDFECLLANADAVADFTSSEWCLVCGGYEALALSKPFVTSDTQALRDYFQDAALYAPHNPKAIARAITAALDHSDEYRTRMTSLRIKRQREWNEQLARLEQEIDIITG